MRDRRKEPDERRKREAQLARTMTTVFRCCVMRASFLSPDRADLGEAVKSLVQQMSRPSTSSMESQEKSGDECQQTSVSQSTVTTLQQIGPHANQLVCFRTLGEICSVQGARAESDSSSANVSRRGLGNQRHVQTHHLWIQGMVAANSFVIKKIPKADNICDFFFFKKKNNRPQNAQQTWALWETHASK